MLITDYHAKFYAHELSRVGGTGVDRLSRALFDASVALNPHQIEAALFALRSPLAKGVLLADEVGLGKTIEAGLVLCQLWAERKRWLLVICPASLRKQWGLELSEKFNLPSVILDAKTFKEMQKADIPNPFRQEAILNARRVEVEAFLDSLEPQVETILAEALQSGTSELKAELEKAESDLRAMGLDAAAITAVPKIRELREKIATSGSDPTALTHDIFSHLTTFFSRYYKDGDFLSLRRYKRDTYAIPYEGEEVKLHWANADQFYIKSAENFRDYTFKLSPDEDAPRVTFKLVEADTQKDNTKPTAGQERRFVYQSVIESEGENHLTLGFAYLPLGKDKKQADLNKQAIAEILKESAKGPFIALASPDKSYTVKNKMRNVLEKHLTDYTARNTFDYFIHKDLGGFLRRELDFYIKNEVLHLDDLDEAPEANWRETRARLKALRSIAGKVIRFLGQIEDFQKKLWLKKKFVTACDYVVTLDRIPEAPRLSISAATPWWKCLPWILSPGMGERGRACRRSGRSISSRLLLRASERRCCRRISEALLEQQK